MEENSDLPENLEIKGLPVDLQLGKRIFKNDLYIENYIVKIEIYKPKDKRRKPTIKTINRIFYMLGQLRFISPEEEEEYRETHNTTHKIFPEEER